MAFNLFLSPHLLLGVIIVISCAFINGWTDAPGAITASVSANILSIKKAAALAGLFNFLGAASFMLINNKVALTVFNIATLADNYTISISLVISSLAAVNIYSVIAWFFGIPTSESHGILAAVSGASVYLYKSFAGVSIQNWCLVIIGMFFSVLMGFMLSYAYIKLLFEKLVRRKQKTIKRLHIFSTAFLAFMHGAQDAQKFAALLMLLIYNQNADSSIINVPFFAAVASGVTIALGTLVGSGRIIKKTGNKMTTINLYDGLCANLSSATAILFSSWFGLPVSTTHITTASILGAASGTKKRVSKKDTLDIILAWVLTFPVCFLLSYVICAFCL